METLAGADKLGFAYVRGKKGLGFSIYRSDRDVEWNGCKKGVRNPKLPKKRPAVPVQVSVVLVQVSLCPFLHNLYRYTCSNFSFFF